MTAKSPLLTDADAVAAASADGPRDGTDAVADPSAAAPSAAGEAAVQVKLRILFGARAMLGPGKVLLLEHIRDLGSISAAGRAMGMSYKRAWSLVEEMNAAFRAPLVDSARGGAGGGGAVVTPEGLAVVQAYRAFEAASLRAGAAELAALQALLHDMSDGK